MFRDYNASFTSNNEVRRIWSKLNLQAVYVCLEPINNKWILLSWTIYVLAASWCIIIC
ncbi:hypothetical protein X975_10010, partial [Stegodyphus mimosarum]